MNLPAIANSNVVDLRYYFKFPTGRDWGKGGKLPGLYGGAEGAESGCTHGSGWSTRYMWRNGSQGEVYWYSVGGSGCGADLGLGSWNWPADNQWHYVEQQVNLSAQTITVWLDGRQVYGTGISTVNQFHVSGLFFSTFYGGHDSSWGPQTDQLAYFANFALSTQYIGA